LIAKIESPLNSSGRVKFGPPANHRPSDIPERSTWLRQLPIAGSVIRFDVGSAIEFHVLIAALAKAHTQRVNPEKTLVATVRSVGWRGPERRFRCVASHSPNENTSLILISMYRPAYRKRLLFWW
jgi:hypothetical protein